MNRPVVIGIAGGTGSGKTTITQAIMHEVGGDITILPQDSYYRSFPNLSREERKKINFDHPQSFENELLVEHIRLLRKNVPIEMPVYDFKTNLRLDQKIPIKPSRIIIVEGILIFENEALRNEMDIKVYVDTDADLRILRRIERDMRERARTLESVISQYCNTVRPMHIEFVEPSKRHADVIIPEGGNNKIGVDMIASQIKNILA